MSAEHININKCIKMRQNCVHLIKINKAGSVIEPRQIFDNLLLFHQCQDHILLRCLKPSGLWAHFSNTPLVWQCLLQMGPNSWMYWKNVGAFSAFAQGGQGPAAHLANHKSEVRDSAQHGFQRIIQFLNLFSYISALLGDNRNKLIKRRLQSSEFFMPMCNGPTLSLFQPPFFLVEHHF